MSRELDQKLLASFADLTEAKLAEAILEEQGIPCRLGDLTQIPDVIAAGLGSLGRSTGIWVLATDLERASAAIHELRSAPATVDEGALVAEALAAQPVPGLSASSEGDASRHPERLHRAGQRSRFSAAAQIIAWLFVAATVAALVRLW